MVHTFLIAGASLVEESESGAEACGLAAAVPALEHRLIKLLPIGPCPHVGFFLDWDQPMSPELVLKSSNH